LTGKVTPIRGHLQEASAPRRRNGGGVLPEDCPVIPLGKQLDIHYYLDACGQFMALEARAHNKNMITCLFAPRGDYLLKYWPKKLENGIAVDFRPDAVSRDLMQACGADGVWSPSGRLRGRGAWAGEDGDLVLHLGDRIWVNGQLQRPGVRNRHVYPVRPERPTPARERQPGGEEGPAAQLLGMLRSWHWARGELDARLMLGWCCAGMLCGALDWRPHAWIGGPRGTGKSTLMRLVEWLFVKDEGIVTSADPTDAAIRSKLGNDALPVAFDEAESSEDNAKLFKLIKLALIASSGGTIDRGTQDHGNVEFTARFMGLFASIARPPLTPAELSRIAMLNLRKLEGGRPPALKRDAMQTLGQQLLRRMVDRWRIFQGRLEVYHEALGAAGLDSRASDHWGTLLAAADTALDDEEPLADQVDDWVGKLVEATSFDRAEEKSDGERCLEQLLTTVAQHWRKGEQRTIGFIVALAARRAVLVDEETGEAVRPGAGTVEEAQRMLAAYGLRVVPLVDPATKRVQFVPARDEGGAPILGAGDMLGHLAVANNHAELNKVFDRTPWRGRSESYGGWKTPLEGLTGAVIDGKRSYGGVASRGVLVPLDLVLASPDDNEG
jgi:hypothetical protein